MEKFEPRIVRRCGNLTCLKLHVPTPKVTWMLCAGCRSQSYCDKLCQRAHWKIHKNKCLHEQDFFNDPRIQEPIAKEANICYSAAAGESFALEQGLAARSSLRLGLCGDLSQTHLLHIYLEWCPPETPVDLKDFNQTRRCFRFIDAETYQPETWMNTQGDWDQWKATFEGKPRSVLPYRCRISIKHKGDWLFTDERKGAIDTTIYEELALGRKVKINPFWKESLKKAWTEDVDLQDTCRGAWRKLEDYLLSEGTPESEIKEKSALLVKKLVRKTLYGV